MTNTEFMVALKTLSFRLNRDIERIDAMQTPDTIDDVEISIKACRETIRAMRYHISLLEQLFTICNQHQKFVLTDVINNKKDILEIFEVFLPALNAMNSNPTPTPYRKNMFTGFMRESKEYS
jgi:hypothetical protein